MKNHKKGGQIMRSTYYVKILKEETVLVDFGDEISEEDVKERLFDEDYEDIIDVTDEEILDIIEIY